jgi:hypothetical protein
MNRRTPVARKHAFRPGLSSTTQNTLLDNVARIDAYNTVFDPDAPRNILSGKEIEERRAYNAPRDFADLEKLWMYTAWPDHVHPDCAPKDFGTLAEEANKYVHHTLDAADCWDDSRVEREKRAHGLSFTFNFQRLVRALEVALSSLDASAGDCAYSGCETRVIK